jgi:hypothetical protein
MFGLILLAQALARSGEPFEPRRWQRVVLWVVALGLFALETVSLALAGREASIQAIVTRVFETAGVDPAMAREREQRAQDVLTATLLQVGVGSALAALALIASRRFRAWVARAVLTRGPLTALGVGFVAFAATSPYLLLRYGQTLRAILHLSYQGTTLGWGGGLAVGARDYLEQLFWQFGPGWWLAVGIGTLLAVLADNRMRRWLRRAPESAAAALPLRMLGLAGGLYFLAFAGHRTPYMWYMLPASLALSLLAAAGLMALRSPVAEPLPRRLIGSAVVLTTLAWPLGASLAWLHEVSAVPTQLLALRWLDQNVPAGAVLVRTADSTTPEVLGQRYQVVNLNYGMEKMGWDYLAEVGADYVILSERMHEPWRRAPDRFAAELRGFQWVYQHLQPVAAFAPDDPQSTDRTRLNRRVEGPGIGIYKVPDWRKRLDHTPRINQP